MIKRMSLIAMMTCIMIVCSWLTIPAAVPFTMQTFAVFCSLILLGGKASLTSLMLYVFIGSVGIPVFSGFQGGIGHILGPTGGYIVGFIISAAFYWLLEPLLAKSEKVRLVALVGALLICYLFGTLWFLAVYGIRGSSYSFGAVLSLCVFPYIIPDIIKLALAWFVSKKVRKIYRE